MKKRHMVMLLLLFFTASTYGFYEEKVALEESYSKRIQNTLDKLYGYNLFLVRVDVSLSNPRYEVNHTQESAAKRKDKEKKKVNILPGYPAIKNLNTELYSQLPFDSVTTYIKPRITRVQVDLLVDQSVSKAKVGRASAVATKALNINQKAIKVNIERLDFHDGINDPQNISVVNVKRQLVQNLFYSAVLLILLLLLGAYVYFQRKGMATNANPSAGSPAGASGGLSNLMMSGSGSGTTGGNGGGGSTTLNTSLKHYFDFIHEENSDKFLSLLKRENINIDNLSVIISFLHPRIAAHVIQELDLNHQTKIALNLLDQKMVNRSSIEKLEGHIQKGLECLVGGDHIFQNTFSLIPSEIKENILDALKTQNPVGHQLFRKNVILFDDINLLEDQEVSQFLSEMDLTILSVALISAHEHTKTRLISLLTEDAKHMIEQFLEFRSHHHTPEDIEIAQEKVIALLRQLEREGRIQLRDKIQA